MTRDDHAHPSAVPKDWPVAQAHDAGLRPVGIATLALFALIVVAISLVGGFFHIWDKAAGSRHITGIEQQPVSPPAPRLDLHPLDDRAAIEARAKSKLDGYAWVDRVKGRVRIPIERALELRAKRGWPDEAGKAGP